MNAKVLWFQNLFHTRLCTYEEGKSGEKSCVTKNKNCNLAEFLYAMTVNRRYRFKFFAFQRGINRRCD